MSSLLQDVMDIFDTNRLNAMIKNNPVTELKQGDTVLVLLEEVELDYTLDDLADITWFGYTNVLTKTPLNTFSRVESPYVKRTTINYIMPYTMNDTYGISDSLQNIQQVEYSYSYNNMYQNSSNYFVLNNMGELHAPIYFNSFTKDVLKATVDDSTSTLYAHTDVTYKPTVLKDTVSAKVDSLSFSGRPIINTNLSVYDEMQYFNVSKDVEYAMTVGLRSKLEPIDGLYSNGRYQSVTNDSRGTVSANVDIPSIWICFYLNMLTQFAYAEKHGDYKQRELRALLVEAYYGYVNSHVNICLNKTGISSKKTILRVHAFGINSIDIDTVDYYKSEKAVSSKFNLVAISTSATTNVVQLKSSGVGM